MVFTMSPSSKKIKWSSSFYKDKYKANFFHNEFACLLNEFEDNDNLDLYA